MSVMDCFQYPLDTEQLLRKKRRIRHLKVVYSKEEPRTPLPSDEQKGTAGRAVPGSVSFVPPVAGMILAGEVVKALASVSQA